jgi:hypothetical protein
MRYHPLHHKKTATSNRRLLVGDVLGWLGAVSLIGAYLLVSLGVISAQSFLYQIMNIVGGGGLLVLAVMRRAYPSAVTNVMWVIIGLVALVGLAFGS